MLTGDYHVRVVVPAFHEARKLWPRTRDRMEVRRHALKLRFFPQKRPDDEQGVVLDVDWSWIKALRKFDVGELRLSDRIGGVDNARVIFWPCSRIVAKHPLPMLWILAVMQKRRNEFTGHDVERFKARRVIIEQRFYGGS